MGKLILVRHGESKFNRENKFTGAFDAPLTSNGVQQAIAAAKLIDGHTFDAIHCSSLIRAMDTRDTIMRCLGYDDDSLVSSAESIALNERDYGKLTGLNKDEAKRSYGSKLVRQWRRSYFGCPPGGESLADTKNRVVEYYQTAIQADCHQGKTVLVVAHGNSLRGLVGHLLGYSPDMYQGIEIAWCTPWIIQFDNTLIDNVRVLPNQLVDGHNRVQEPNRRRTHRIPVSFACA